MLVNLNVVYRRCERRYTYVRYIKKAVRATRAGWDTFVEVSLCTMVNDAVEDLKKWKEKSLLATGFSEGKADSIHEKTEVS